MSFQSLVEPVTSRPKSLFNGPAGSHGFIRDQFSTTTWLALGALAQGLLFLVVGPLALTPAVLLLGYRLADTYLITIGWRTNPYMEGIIPRKFSAQIPDAKGNFSDKPVDSQVVVFLLGTRNNHPMGLLAPGFKEMGDYFTGMVKYLEDNADDFGFLGMTNWLSPNQRESNNELMNVCYFRSHEGLHKFAHSEHHRQAWSWYNKLAKTLPHLSIWHETYVVPKGSWETIYINSHAGHMASTTYKIKDQSGEDRWASPIVDANRGLLRTGKGRLSWTDASENDQYEKNELLPDTA